VGSGGHLRARLGFSPLAHQDPAVLALAAPLSGASRTPGETGARTPRGVSTLRVSLNSQTWLEQPTLLTSGSDDRVFRLEIDDSGAATVTFGDGVFGAQPPIGEVIQVGYRIGGGD